MRETAIANAPTAEVSNSDDSVVWLEALPARVYQTPQYGEVAITPDRLERMVNNFKQHVRGQEVATDFDHGMDRAKGNKASGWFRDFDLRPSPDNPSYVSLFAAVEFTDEARKEIKDNQWKYFSLEWEDSWQDNSGNTHQDVITGGGITNRPIAKNMMPINFSESMWQELDDEARRTFTMWSKARKQRAKGMSEEVVAAIELLENEVFNESKEWEHSEPGTGGTPEPRTDQDGSDDPAIDGGWRRDPLPLDPSDPNAPKPNSAPPISSEIEPDIQGGGGMTPEQIAELKKLFKLSESATDEEVYAAVTTVAGEMNALRDAVGESTQEKHFSEQYPHVWREHQELLDRDRTNTARSFAESVRTVNRAEGESFKPTNRAFTALAQDKVAEMHKKFSEGTASISDFEDCVKTIMNGGIIEFGEVGSSSDKEAMEFSTSTNVGIASARKLFSEKIAEIQKEDNLDMRAAYAEASKRYPELAQAYHTAMPA